jgi:glutamate-1-semialdehyde 2,1-aminomutase
MQAEKKHNNQMYKGEKVLITGASGFIGSALAKRLIELGADVYGTSRQQPKNTLGINWWIGDLTDIDFVHRLIREIQPDYIFHLAGYVTGSRDIEHVLPTFHNNLLTTVNLLNSTHNAQCKRIIIGGSSEEPHPHEKESIPASPYASAKIASSNYAKMFYNLYGTPISNAKIFMVFGPGQSDNEKLLPHVIINTIKGKSPKISSGDRLVDWIYLDNVVDGLVQMMDINHAIDGETVALGSGKLISIKEIAQLTKNLINPEIEVHFGAVKDRPFEQSRMADIKKTYEQIGWKPEVGLKEGLLRKIEHYKSLYDNETLKTEESIPEEGNLSSNTDKYVKAKQLQKRFNKIVPGGCHTYAKGDDQFPEFMPPYIVRGKGCRVWDVDGNEYIVYGMGLRSVTLGHAFGPVIESAYSQMQKGTNFTRPSLIEMEYAEEFLDLFEGVEMVKFGKNGSDVTNGAVRLSRAYTGRQLVAICADHPFYSIDDWFIGTTPMSAGIPQATKDLTVKFNYNDIESVKALFEKYPGQIACVILEPEKYIAPQNDFLHELKNVCHQNGTLFVLDEMITGFRVNLGGAQSKYNIVPDLSTFGKAIANGFSVSALTGKREIMKLGGTDHDKELVFLLSLTHGAETHSLAAARATLDFYKEKNVISALAENGRRLRERLTEVSSELKLSDYFKIVGPDYNSVYTTLGQDKTHSEYFRTLFLQETMKRGLLMPSTVISYAHDEGIIEETAEKVYDALTVYKKALAEGVDKYLVGRPVKPVLRKYR